MDKRRSAPPRLKVVMETEKDYEKCAVRLKALVDPDSLRIISCLFKGPGNVSELANELGEDLVKVSHHLGVLRHASVVQTEKHGKFVIYSLDPEIAASEHWPDMKTLDVGCCRLGLLKPNHVD